MCGRAGAEKSISRLTPPRGGDRRVTSMHHTRATPRRLPINADGGWALLLLLLCGWHIAVDPQLRDSAAVVALVVELFVLGWEVVQDSCHLRNGVVYTAACLARTPRHLAPSLMAASR